MRTGEPVWVNKVFDTAIPCPECGASVQAVVEAVGLLGQVVSVACHNDRTPVRLPMEYQRLGAVVPRYVMILALKEAVHLRWGKHKSPRDWSRYKSPFLRRSGDKNSARKLSALVRLQLKGKR